MSILSAFGRKIEADELPELPLRELVLFPHTLVPVFLAQKAAIAAAEEASRRDRRVYAVWAPKGDDVESSVDAGCVARITQQLKLPDGTMRVLLEGEYRARSADAKRKDSYRLVRVEPIGQEEAEDSETLALSRALQKSFAQYAELSKKVTPDAAAAVEKADGPERLCNIVANVLTVKADRKLALLVVEGAKERLRKTLELVELENEIIGIQKRISGRVKTRMDKNQREYILNEQLKEINKELGKDGEKDEFAELQKSIEAKGPPAEVLAKTAKELARLRKLQPLSPEAGVLRGYLEWIADLPWTERREGALDLAAAEAVLDEDHFGLEKAKERVLEFIAVRQLVSAAKGPILCFVGPPGTGKTSLGRSVARALGRDFVRMSLGGVRDEAEIRGHRKTYVGALPGKILQSMRKAGSNNPVFLLDEIDKMSSDFRGDPASALLEVLDPEQNSSFQDHYLEVPYDLSKVLFIATANSIHGIPYPLLDRMELIEIPGYGEREKLEIARLFLVPKQLRENGLDSATVSFRSDALRDIIRYWTMESGVRGLERELARCARRIAREAVRRGYRPEGGEASAGTDTAHLALVGGGAVGGRGTTGPVEGDGRSAAGAAPAHGVSGAPTEASPESALKALDPPEPPEGAAAAAKPISAFRRSVTKDGLEKLLGRRKRKDDFLFGEMKSGVAYGLAWTEIGGTILPIEVARFPGNGELILTGNLGDVMKESARIALSYLRGASERWGLDPSFARDQDFHLHVPEGAIPKDGPSAGAALATALLSCVADVPIRPRAAITGELTLTGRVLAVGGIKEKLLAAARNGMELVLMPKANEDEYQELDEDLKKNLRIVLIETAEEAFDLLFEGRSLVKAPGPKHSGRRRSARPAPEEAAAPATEPGTDPSEAPRPKP